jgi:hypothetical protein
VAAVFFYFLCFSLQAADFSIRITNPPLAILKLSYNRIGETPCIGGICGSAFFIDSKTALTAAHVINPSLFSPNPGFQKCQFWIVGPNLVAEFWSSNLVALPNLDAAAIFFPSDVAGVVPIPRSQNPPALGETVFNVGFVGGTMPQVDAVWTETGLTVRSADLTRNYAGAVGTLTFVGSQRFTARDVQIDSVVMVTSYGGVVGMSGGALVRASTQEAIGLMSFGLPQDAAEKTNLAAVSLTEIEGKLSSLRPK